MIAAFDPGLANLGIALLDLRAELVEAAVVVTAADKGARGDEQRRIAELAARCLPIIRRATLVAIEWPPSAFGSAGGHNRNSAAASTTGKVAAMIAGAAWGAGRAPWLAAPVTWRSRLGYRAGREAELHGAMMFRYGEQLAHVRRSLLPHALDAIGLARARLELAD